MTGLLTRQHATVREVAEALGVTVQAVHKRVKTENWPFSRGSNRAKLLSVEKLPEDVRVAVMKEALPAVAGPAAALPESEPTYCREQIDKAMAKADLLRFYLKHMSRCKHGCKAEARKDFMLAYNSGIAYPELFDALGELSWKTIEGWKVLLKKKRDTFELADRRGYHRRGRCALTDVHKEIVLKCALHPNKPLISEAIRMARAVMHTKGIANGLSDSTYRRFLDDWAKRHFHIWTFHRKGAKAWNDECAFYIERDYDLINVGDVLVADGHHLNFDILNPWTGKPQRMVLILWQDMKSGFPLGWEIMPTENTQAISAALRRAIIRLGKYPQVAYLDNGKAFSARFFNGADLEQAGFSGLYDRLKIKTIFAWPYHGQSKTVERLFGSFAEIERWCPTYTGTSIDKKPPRMNRGERLHRRVYDKIMGGRGLTIEQAHRAIAAWFDDYVQRERTTGHLKGTTPLAVFEAEMGSGVDRTELQYLMMHMEIRHIRRNGINFRGQNYFAKPLYKRRHPVVIRYDLQDPSYLLVYEPDNIYGKPICVAEPVEKVHPAANALGSDEDKERLKHFVALKNDQQREASVFARSFLETDILPEYRRQLEMQGIAPEAAAKGKVKRIPKKMTAEREARVLAEVEQRTAADAGSPYEGLENLSEMDRYEKLLESEVCGLMIPKQYRAFMRYYEGTEEYTRHETYWEEYRVKTALTHQIAEGDR